MGCDIHSYAERKAGDKYETVESTLFTYYDEPFGWRAYGMFAFLAGVQNYSGIPPISEPRGIPADASTKVAAAYDDWSADAHSASWLSVDELEAFDYDQPVEDRRVTRQTSWGWDGGCAAEPGGGTMTTYREFLGDGFFKDIKTLREVGADRVVFWFDN